ncbi:DHH family phosphoesterase [Enterococcus hirae]|nr:DHH family phosphoesterase [Enterococcus hirae]
MKKVKRKLFFLTALILFCQLLIIFFAPQKAILAGAVLAATLIWLYVIRQVEERVALSNKERIHSATMLAQTAIGTAIDHVPLGIIVYNSDRKVEWYNNYAFQSLLALPSFKDESLDQLFTISESQPAWLETDQKVYHIEHDEVHQAFYFTDVTKEVELLKEKKAHRVVTGVLSIDNYDDATGRMDEKQISYLNSFLTTMISDWMEKYSVFYKRLNAEKYFFLCYYDHLEQMIEKRFNLLDIIRKESADQDIPITISMGIAYGSGHIDEIGKLAQTNLDIALVRGGDQVVLKADTPGAKPVYYGGKTTSVAKRTRVRSRAMATALGELIENASNVFVMGHRFPDMDALGSAVGVAHLAHFYQKDVKVVINRKESISDVQKALIEIDKNPQLQDLIISPEDALKELDQRSLLIMVDYHKPSMSISPELYAAFKNVVIIDHHRRGEEFPKDPLLVYIESGASSTCELVTELIEYKSSRKNRLSKLEATLLYSGIVVDTKSFKIRTTSRTFEAARHLRLYGAETSLVNELLSSDLSSYLSMTHLTSRVEFITEDILVATGEDDRDYGSLITAKAADTLLSMQGINASFVITKRDNGQIGISARSKGKINVQLIMEAMGGGGHFTNAAVQLSDTTVGEVKARLLKIIKEKMDEIYIEE